MTSSFPFKRPEPPSTFSMGDHIGDVVIVIVGGYHQQVPTQQYGVKPAASLTIVILTGPKAGVVVEDVMLFGKACSQFETSAVGDVLLCRIVKSGRANVFEPGGTYDEQIAQQWLTSNPNRLDELVTRAPQNFAEQVKQLNEQANGARSGATSPQFVPPGATVTQGPPQPAPYAGPTTPPPATMQTLQHPGLPAASDVTGF